MRMKRFFRMILLLTAAVLLTALSASAEDALSFLPLKNGSKGQEVLELKKRLKELGYYQSGEFTKRYTEDTDEKIREFQRTNSLPVTGETDEVTWTLLFSDQALKAVKPTLPPLATPAPTPVPDWPERDPDGYLADGEEYFFEDDEAGLWIYLGKDLQIVITHREDSSIPLEWFETEIWTRNGEAFRTAATDPEHPGRKFQYPDVISRNEKFVLGFSDDFYGNRMAEKETVGIIIRNGQIFSQKTNRKTGHHLPNLDMMAQFPDGRLEVYPCNAHTAEELLEMGAVNVFSFGPILLKDGEINDLVYTYYKSIEPRHALGMIAPGHYFLLSVQGRRPDSRGTTLQRMAEIMNAHGVQQALNLDGGNTMALVFRGRMLNKMAVYKNKSFVRTMTSLIGIGYTENQAEE